jgi:hypothetical protein
VPKGTVLSNSRSLIPGQNPRPVFKRADLNPERILRGRPRNGCTLLLWRCLIEIDSQDRVEVDPAIWAGRVREVYGDSVTAVVKVGRVLEAAKAALGPVTFRSTIWYDAVGFKWGKRTADRYIAISRDPVLSDARHSVSLPSSWGTLYVLTRLPREAKEAAIRDRRIFPDMTRREAKALLEGGSKAAKDWSAGGALGSERLKSLRDYSVPRDTWSEFADGVLRGYGGVRRQHDLIEEALVALLDRSVRERRDEAGEKAA